MRRLALRSSASTTFVAAMRAGSAAFGHIEMGPADPILGLSVAFAKDPSPKKVNLGVGVYRCDEGKPYVLPSVRKAEQQVVLNTDNHEYAPISGIPGFVENAQRLAFGADSSVVKSKRAASAQSLSGTGALRVAADFLARFYPTKRIVVPKPTWGNHHAIFRDAGLTVDGYRYHDPATNKLDFEGLMTDLEALPDGTIVLLHACAHNPTGNDPTQEQWKAMVDLVKRKGHFPLVDMAYQGFASGDLERDAFGLRLLAESVPTLCLCQSFAKSFGLYGQRCGAVHFVCEDEAEKERVLSQLKILIRPKYSNPPLYGARVVDTILNDDGLTQMWRTELTEMADRMNGIRVRLVDELAKNGSTRDWTHITTQIGMMAFTGLNKDQVRRIKEEFHVYMTDDGRAAVSGLNSKNVEYVAKALHAVTK